VLITEIDSATVPLWQAMTKNQTMKQFLIKWYRLNPQIGKEEEYLTTTLDQVRVTSLEMILPNTKEAKKEAYKHVCRLELRYEQITLSHVDGFEAMDAWKVAAA